MDIKNLILDCLFLLQWEIRRNFSIEEIKSKIQEGNGLVLLKKDVVVEANSGKYEIVCKVLIKEIIEKDKP